MNRVLIVSRSDDALCVARVREALEQRGMSTLVLNTNRFPSGENSWISAEPLRFSARLADVDLDEICAVWYRRMNVGADLPVMQGEIRRACIQESHAYILSLIETLDVPKVDPWATIRRAELKPLQLREAARAGLRIPRTLITNDPAEAEHFAGTTQGRLIAKTLTSFAVQETSQNSRGWGKVVFTSALPDRSETSFQGLELSPMVLQERVKTVKDARATIIGDHVFVATLDASPESLDWRRCAREAARRFVPGVLPLEVIDALLRLMRSLGLHYGACDLVLDDEGEWWFLEINPCGEFFWLDFYTGLPLCAALADLLVTLAQSRNS